MDKFDELMNELIGAKTAGKPGEEREIVIRYTVGNEDEPKIVKCTGGKDGPKEDSYVLLHAAGKKLSESTGLDAEQLSGDLVAAAMISMIESLKKEVEDLWK